MNLSQVPKNSSIPSNSSSNIQEKQKSSTSGEKAIRVHSVSNSPERLTFGELDDEDFITDELLDFCTSSDLSLPDTLSLQDNLSQPEISEEDLDAFLSSTDPSLERNTNLPVQALSAFQSSSSLPPSLAQAPSASKRASPSPVPQTSEHSSVLPASRLSETLLLPVPIPLSGSPALIQPLASKGSFVLPASAASKRPSSSPVPPPSKRSLLASARLRPTSTALAASLALTRPPLSARAVQLPTASTLSAPSQSIASPALAQPSSVQALPAFKIPPVPPDTEIETYTDFACAMGLDTTNILSLNTEISSNEWRRLVCAIETDPNRVLKLLQNQQWKPGPTRPFENKKMNDEFQCNRIICLAYIIYLNRLESASIKLPDALQIIFTNLQDPTNRTRSMRKWFKEHLVETIGHIIKRVRCAICKYQSQLEIKNNEGNESP